MELVQFLKSGRGGELLGIVTLAAGLIIGAALCTYHPGDSSAYFTSSRIETANAVGYYGATLSWLLVGFFGFSSLLVPVSLLITGWNRFWGRDTEYFRTKVLGLLCLIAFTPPLLDLIVGSVWLRGSLVQSGGYLGHEVNRAISLRLNTSGAAIVLLTAVLIGLLLATRISLGAIFMAITEAGRSLLRAGTLYWARFTERRRKEKMKSTLIRKHLDRAEEPAPPPLRLVPGGETPAPMVERRLVVREVRGQGKFQIRKVTKADLRKVAQEIAEEGPDFFESDVTSAGRFSAEAYDEFEDVPTMELLPPIDPPRKPAPRVATPKAELPRIELPRLAMPKPKESRPATTVRDSAPNLSTERLPFVNLLTAGPQQGPIDEEVHKRFLEVGRLIQDRCREFSVEGEVTAYHPGPVVTTFEFKPSAGVKYAKVVNLGDDLALGLKAESIRIERISGSSTVGIEVPNKKRELITLRDIIETDAFTQSTSVTTLALGKDIHGDAVVTDLARMPHLLVAGATGAGKSVGLNSMIVSMLYKALPSQLRMLMIDPKMVELKIYEDIPHLLHPIVTDPKLASNALLWAVQEMENRYRTLAECGVRNIDQYNALLKDPDAHRKARKVSSEDTTPQPEPLPYIVIIIDEFADLMMVASKDVEDSVTRIAQKARAVGIHLIIATQRPSVDVITGVIKANFPSRISFQVASKIDSRTILDAQGAERLLGNGDMLFLPPGTARIRRIHGAYVSEKEIVEIVDFVKKNQGVPKYCEEITKSAEEKSGVDGIEYLDDPKYDDAVRVVLSTGQASASYLQRRLKLGYSRAARLVEIMEANGILGPSQGSKPREILVRSDDYPPAQEA
ncbi:MAG TPA: DNA translocase FtsK [Thermoanaerobaculia bacterium]|nr:DNA translocase FtsK [Thermoanaerobaculia bacterium]